MGQVDDDAHHALGAVGERGEGWVAPALGEEALGAVEERGIDVDRAPLAPAVGAALA